MNPRIVQIDLDSIIQLALFDLRIEGINNIRFDDIKSDIVNILESMTNILSQEIKSIDQLSDALYKAYLDGTVTHYYAYIEEQYGDTGLDDLIHYSSFDEVDPFNDIEYSNQYLPNDVGLIFLRRLFYRLAEYLLSSPFLLNNKRNLFIDTIDFTRIVSVKLPFKYSQILYRNKIMVYLYYR